MTALDRAIKAAARRRRSCGSLTEMERILALPVWDPTHETKTDLARLWTRRLRVDVEAPPLTPDQGYALEALHRASKAPNMGAALALAVGAGKTLVSHLAPHVLGARRPLWLIPASLQSQWWSDVEAWRRWYPTPHDPTVLTYGRLSRPESTAILDGMVPDLIVADEADYLGGRDSARVKRVIRFFQNHPTTRFVPMTGTFANASVAEFDHLLELALREATPLPRKPRDVSVWVSCTSPRADAGPEDHAALSDLVDAFSDVQLADPKTRAQRAVGARVRSAPGVVCSDRSSTTAGLFLRTVHTTPPPAVTDALKGLTARWELPEGTQLVDALEVHRHGLTLSLGFWLEWDWSDWTDEDAQEWLDRRSHWSSIVRSVLTNAPWEGRDSRSLLEQAAMEGRTGPAITQAWTRWEEVKDRPQPPTRTMWLPGAQEWLVDLVERWRARHPEGGLVWYRSKAVGTVLGGVGSGQAAPSFLDTTHPAVSMVHSKGWNAQEWHRQLVLEPPGSSKRWEQLLGRTHRQGQDAPRVWCDVLHHTAPLRRQLENACQKANFAQNTLTVPMKLCHGRWVEAVRL